MKKLLVIAALLMFGLSSNAQYYYIPYLNAGINPGNLNLDTEYPVGGGQPAGWTSIHPGSAAAAAWSSIATIPFSFNFNGSAVTSYKVSTTGVLTFNTAAATAPDVNNVALPSASVPDNSICVWGITGSGSNDNICYKTFGTAPNRQHWIIFSSYSEVGSACYTYWAIVLEETTDRIHIVDQRHAGCGLTLTLGIQVDNATAFQVSGSPNVAAVAGANATSSDNSYYTFIPGVQAGFDISATSVTVKKYLSLALAPFSITGTLQNFGSNAITSMDLNYSINGGATVTVPVTGINIASGASYNFTHTTPWTPAIAGAYTVAVWASNLNGNADENTANDIATKSVFVANTLAQRLVLFEQFTSSTCGPCATANPAFNTLLNANPGKVTSIKYQMNYPAPGTDPAYTPECMTRHTYYGVSGIPHVNMSGVVFDGHPANMNQAIIDNDFNNNPGLFDMNLSFNITGGNTVNINLACTSLVDIASSNLVAHIVVTENHVNHAPQTNGETDFYQVMRKMLPDPNGTTMTSQTISQVTNFNPTYVFNPAVIDADEITVVAFIQDAVTKEIFQSAYAPPSPVGITTTSKSAFFGRVYPNPASSMVNIPLNNVNKELTFRLTDIQGRVVYSEIVPSGKDMIRVNLENIEAGAYFYELSDKNVSLETQKLIVTH